LTGQIFSEQERRSYYFLKLVCIFITFLVAKLNCHQIIMAHAHSSDNLFDNGNQHFPYDDLNCTTLLSDSDPHEQLYVACSRVGSAVGFS
jgi:hypothetical protein